MVSAEALVVNQADCELSLGGNVWSGSSTAVVTPSGKINLQCNATLVSGPGVSEQVIVNVVGCRAILTSAGTADILCNF